jgi:4-aminobutyrate aminotransferase
MVNSEEIMKKDKQYYIQGYTRKNVVLTEGKGSILKDIDGKEYIDCFAGIAVTNAGHAPERLVKAATEQMSKLVHTSGVFYNIPQTLLVEKLAEITPNSLKHSYLCNSGTEAIDNAVKLAKKYAYSRGKTGAAIIALECSFHGRLGVAFSLTGQAKYKNGFGSYAIFPGVAHAAAPYCYRSRLSEEDCALEMASKVEDTINRQTAGDVAAFVMEPVLGEGGIIIPPALYYKELQKILAEYEIPFIADEVQSGFGRTGKMFSFEHWDLKPDLVTMAKGLGGGMPIGAVTTTTKVANCVQAGDFFSTFGGNPVSCAVALENINILQDEGLIGNSAKIGKQFMIGLKELQEKYSVIGDVRGLGLMIGIELVKDQITKEPAVKKAKKAVSQLLKNGIIIGLGGVFTNVLRLQPPLCITDQQAANVLQKMDETLKTL